MTRYLLTALFATQTCLLASAHAQTPLLINYQGRLVDGTNLVNGPVAIRFELHDHPSNNNPLFASTNSAVVIDGLYATMIGEHVVTGSLDAALSGPEAWLQVIVNGQPLSPRERLVAVPYARQVHGLAVGENQSIVMAPHVGNTATNAGREYGVVSGGRSNRVEGSYSSIGGGRDNKIEMLSGSTVIGGGERNVVQSFVLYSTIGGGRSNIIASTTQGATLGGGEANNIFGNADFATIPGGFGNRVIKPYGFAAGRRAIVQHDGSFVWGDSTEETAQSSTSNQVTFRAGGGFRVLGGAISGDASGLSNFPAVVLQNRATGGGDAIAFSTNNRALAVGSATLGGFGNVVSNGATYGTVGGGLQNVVGANASMSTIGGGQNNLIRTDSGHATVAGGLQNSVETNAPGAFVGGGFFNRTFSAYSVLAGGYENIIQSLSSNAVISGGQYNEIYRNAGFASIGGGQLNIIGTNATRSTIGGGAQNRIATDATDVTIGGGLTNVIASSFGTISGGRANFIQIDAAYGAIGGGQQNLVDFDGIYATIGGGWTNRASGGYSTIGGGLRNIADGSDATIGGGHANRASGLRSTVPGGSQNEAFGDYSLAAGRRAKANHEGSFVWADGTNADFSSGSSNQFLIRAAGGVGIGVANPEATLQVDATTNQEAFRVRSGGATKFWVRKNGGTVVGTFAEAPENGLHVGGNTGLGTANPIERLHVVGGVHLAGSARDISVPPADNLQIGHYDGTNFTERMRINTAGNVGVGTSSPEAGSKLDVNGRTRTANLTVTDSVIVQSNLVNRLVPIAAGTVNADGTIFRGTGNFNVTLAPGNVYRISVTNYTVDPQCVTYVTLNEPSFLIPWTREDSGDLIVHVRNSSGNNVQAVFSFVAYKLNL